MSTGGSAALNSKPEFTQGLDQTLDVLLSRGEDALSADDRQAAFSYFARATELDPNNATAWIKRAQTTADSDDAITSWAYALALAPGNEQAKVSLDEQIRAKTDTSQTSDIPSLFALGKALAKVGLKPQAASLFERVTELDESNEEAWIWRAGLTDNPEDMIPLLNLVLTLNPHNAKAQAGLRWAMSQLGQKPLPPVDEPVQIPLSPKEQAAKLVEEGHKNLNDGDKESAHALFKQATQLDLGNEEAWLWCGSTTADIEVALVCMEQALAINPNNKSAREARSWLRVKRLRENSRTTMQTSLSDLTHAPLGAPKVTSERWRSNLGILIAAVLVVFFVFVVLFFLRIII